MVTPGSVLYFTVMNAAFVPRWLTMHRSITRHRDDVRFLVCCWDHETRRLVDGLQRPNVETMSLSELEARDPELASARAGRTFREYRSTTKPILCRYMFERNPEVEVVVYLDADLMFFGDPHDFVSRLGDASILLVPHRFPSPHSSETFGLYQGGSLVFRRGPDADEALAWWSERCLEWCSYRPEPGRWADQRYLHDWPQRFRGVRVTDDAGIGPAPWNSSAHRVHEAAGRVVVDGRPLIFFHHSGLLLASGARWPINLLEATSDVHLQKGPVPLAWALPHHDPTPTEVDLVWKPYVEEVSSAFDSVRALDPSFDGGLVPVSELVKRVAVGKRLRGVGKRVLGPLLERDVISLSGRVRRAWRT